MAAILTTLHPQTADCQWFTADVEVHGAPPNPVLSTSDHVVGAGTTADLIAQLVHIPQVFSGVFLAIPQDVIPSSWIQRFMTDDPPLRTLGPARFELRAFDTTYLEIYAHTWEDLEALATRFNGQILPLPDSE